MCCRIMKQVENAGPQKPLPIAVRRGQMESCIPSLGPDRERECTSRGFGWLPVSVSSSPQMGSHRDKPQTQSLALRGMEGFCMVSVFCVNGPVRRPAQVWQGAPPASSCVFRRLGEQLSCLEASRLELQGCRILQVRHQEAPSISI